MTVIAWKPRRRNFASAAGQISIVHAPKTVAEVHSLSNGYSANLLHGTVIASSPEGQTFQLVANGATVRPASAHATVARITWVSANELLLSSNLGAIQVTYEGDVKTIEPGSSVRMEIKTEEASSSPDRRVRFHGGRSHAIYFVIVAAAVANRHRNLARDGEQPTKNSLSLSKTNSNSPKR